MVDRFHPIFDVRAGGWVSFVEAGGSKYDQQLRELEEGCSLRQVQQRRKMILPGTVHVRLGP